MLGNSDGLKVKVDRFTRKQESSAKGRTDER